MVLYLGETKCISIQFRGGETLLLFKQFESNAMSNTATKCFSAMVSVCPEGANERLGALRNLFRIKSNRKYWEDKSLLPEEKRALRNVCGDRFQFRAHDGVYYSVKTKFTNQDIRFDILCEFMSLEGKKKYD